jgi:4-hydroxy-tetrahydrodipicolinate synthase
VNLSNEVTLQLAEHGNIVGIKDCSADPIQSFELLRSRPKLFAVLTGEDNLFHGALTQGADGGILAAAHVETAGFALVRDPCLRATNPARAPPGTGSSIWRGCSSPSQVRRRSSIGCGEPD